MKIIKPSVEIIDQLNQDEIIQKLERCGRVCYKSEGNITYGSGEKFIQSIIRRGHESVLEHVSFTVKFVCDRGVSHEIVRHRLASYSQESTRYCNYSGDKFGHEITVVEPSYLAHDTNEWTYWERSCLAAEMMYFNMLNSGSTAQEARAVLPNSLKTELVMSANIREWRHFLKLRCSGAAHPQMREVAVALLEQLQTLLPVLFGDLSM